MEGEEARGKMAEEEEERGRTVEDAEKKERAEGVGRQKGSRVGERGLRERMEEAEAGEMERRYEERGEKGRGEADGQIWASPVAHNPATP